MNYKPEQLTDEIRALGLKTGADLVGFTSAIKLEEGAPKRHKPSVLMSKAKSIITLASGRKLNEDREYEYEWGPGYSKTHIKLKDHLVPLREEARKSVEAVKDLLKKKISHSSTWFFDVAHVILKSIFKRNIKPATVCRDRIKNS